MIRKKTTSNKFVFFHCNLSIIILPLLKALIKHIFLTKKTHTAENGRLNWTKGNAIECTLIHEGMICLLYRFSTLS